MTDADEFAAEYADRPFTTDVEDCARCGGDHEIVASPFTRPPENYSHYAVCPETEEPILVAVLDDGDDEPPGDVSDPPDDSAVMWSSTDGA